MVDPNHETARAAVPLHVVTGFLGSGKTTLLRELLAARGEGTAVLVNEVGDLGIDHHLLERIDEDLLLMPGGCICCAMRDRLNESLERILRFGPRRIVLETTGLADPAPLLHTIGEDPRMKTGLRLAGVIAVVDGLRAETILSGQPEALRQLDFADRIVISRADLATPERLATVRELLEELAPGRLTRAAREGRIDPDWLLADGGFDTSDAGLGLRAWLGRTPVADATEHLPFSTHGIRHDRPVRIETLQLWLRLVTQIDGPRLLRIKALVRSAEDGRCRVLQSAERAVSPPLLFERDLPQLAGAEVVVIERGLPPAALDSLLASLRSALAET